MLSVMSTPVLADGTEVRTSPATAAANLIKETDASLVRFENVNTALAAGYTERLATHGEEHLLCQNCSSAYEGLNPQDPSSLVYAINVKGHPPILLGAMYLMGNGNGPQVGGGVFSDDLSTAATTAAAQAALAETKPGQLAP